jgi:hypothetical protein
MLKCKVIKVIRDIRRRKLTADDSIPADLFKDMGDNGLKILTVLVKKR